MPRRVKLKPHLTGDELYERYIKSKRATERDRYHALWLLSTGKTTRDVSQVTRFGVRGVRNLAKRYNDGGPDSMLDRRRNNTSEKRLNPEQCKELEQALNKPPPDGGLWSGPKVAAWIQEKTGKATLPQLGWDYLNHLDFALRVPRRRHKKGDPEQADEFKKKHFRGPLSGSP